MILLPLLISIPLLNIHPDLIGNYFILKIDIHENLMTSAMTPELMALWYFKDDSTVQLIRMEGGIDTKQFRIDEDQYLHLGEKKLGQFAKVNDSLFTIIPAFKDKIPPEHLEAMEVPEFIIRFSLNKIGRTLIHCSEKELEIMKKGGKWEIENMQGMAFDILAEGEETDRYNRCFFLTEFKGQYVLSAKDGFVFAGIDRIDNGRLYFHFPMMGDVVAVAKGE